MGTFLEIAVGKGPNEPSGGIENLKLDLGGLR
jgi:hypothetical protein